MAGLILPHSSEPLTAWGLARIRAGMDSAPVSDGGAGGIGMKTTIKTVPGL
jgi:hypothetical protein